MDINHLTLDELHELNKQICDRIDEIRTQNDKIALAALRPGMTVQFKNDNQTMTGVLLKKNRKTTKPGGYPSGLGGVDEIFY